jgi:predicted nucleic acid-binding protein
LGSPACEIVPLDDLTARAVGQLCGTTGTDDITDASVAITARQRALRVITSDPDDIRRIDSRIDVVSI